MMEGRSVKEWNVGFGVWIAFSFSLRDSRVSVNECYIKEDITSLPQLSPSLSFS